MPGRWSKLQREFYRLRAESLDFSLHCQLYRMASQWGNTDLPRYWISLNGKIIWDYPKDFIDTFHPKRAKREDYPYRTDVSEISELIREYIDTANEKLLENQFEGDYWDLVDILRSADRRIGVRRLLALKKKTKNQAALKVIEARLGRKSADETHS